MTALARAGAIGYFQRMRGLIPLFVTGAILMLPTLLKANETSTHQVGVAAVDITPEYPVRLSGFGFRRTESEGVTQRIWAKAMAIADAEGRDPVVLVTVDNVGAPDAVVTEIAKRLEAQAGVPRERFALANTHTHTAPMLVGGLSTLFGMSVPDDQQETIHKYTEEFTDKCEQAALAALKDLKPATIEFAIGKATFAKNRRRQGGPVDHDLPMLAIKSPTGELRSVYATYACHCVTLSHNQISGDWAGYAMETIEHQHAGATALISIGCAGDANPLSDATGDKVEVAADQGRQIASEVDRLLAGPLRQITAPVATTFNRIILPFDEHPTRQEWEQRAARDDAIGYHARVQLARLDRGESLQTELSYPIQTWSFGDQLAMVLLPGEVVVDYAVRLKQQYDPSRLWITAYANDVPCYIPSERILKEGGYEGAGAMTYYDRPAPLKTGVEELIINEVGRQIPDGFAATAKR